MASSAKADMNPDLAKYLLEHGGALIVTDVPVNTDFGVDLKSWTTASNFKGIKMIPPGFHFFHYSAANEFGELAPRVGFFHIFKEQECVVKRWNVKEETITAEVVPEEEVARFQSNLKNLDKFLGAYPYDVWKAWKELTNKIDSDLIARCQPVCGFVRSALELENNDDASRTRGAEPPGKRQCRGLTSEAREELLLPHLKPVSGTELRLTEIPQRNYPENATPTEITRHSLDSSYVLNEITKKMKDPTEIIGELQLVFICFLVGQSLDSFEHWKKLIGIICGAEKAIVERRAIFVEFLRTVEVQLTHVPEDLLCDIVASENFMYHHLHKLFATIESNSEIDGRLKSEALRISQRLTDKFSWDFSNLQDEADDEAPVVVSDNH